ncbi:MAG: hypothetical protein N4A71_26820 [Carboxylicivirga sp.]|jgi:hypothetical protein|nr:hypothetical protein [Carboxylicivirga sp.]MCT4643919.1 hypothetical protein [Carboxylicivirga sp.]
MSDISTHDFNASEEEAGHWLAVYEKLPDSLFVNKDVVPGSFIISKIKAFARAYQPIKALGLENGIIIN